MTEPTPGRRGLFGRRARPTSDEQPAAENGGSEATQDQSEPMPRSTPASPRPPQDSGAAEPAPARATSQGTVVGPLEALLRHPVLALVPVVVLVGGALALGLLRDPVYSAEARINVGRVDVPAYTLQGVVIGNETIAASYSRTITAQPVIEPAGREVGIGPAEAQERLNASPVPGSTLIRVEAEGPSEGDAAVLANGGANALIRYVERLQRKQASTDLLKQFRSARVRAERAQRRVDRLTGGKGSNAGRLRQARLDLETAQLQSSSLGDQYRASQSGPSAQNLLQLIAPANDADSDFSSVLQRLILIALAAGIVLGLTLSLLRANRALIRRPRG